MSPAHHDHHIFPQTCHKDQTQESSMDLTQSDFDPQVNYWPAQLPWRIHHSYAALCLCTKAAHLAGLLLPNQCGCKGPRTAASRPSKSLSTLITSLISPGPASNSSTSKLDAITLLPINLTSLQPAHRTIHAANYNKTKN